MSIKKVGLVALTSIALTTLPGHTKEQKSTLKEQEKTCFDYMSRDGVFLHKVQTGRDEDPEKVFETYEINAITQGTKQLLQIWIEKAEVFEDPYALVLLEKDISSPDIQILQKKGDAFGKLNTNRLQVLYKQGIAMCLEIKRQDEFKGGTGKDPFWNK